MYVCMYVCVCPFPARSPRDPARSRAVSARSPRGLRAVSARSRAIPRDPARSCADCAFVNIDDTILLLFMGPVLYKGRKPSHSHPRISLAFVQITILPVSHVLGQGRRHGAKPFKYRERKRFTYSHTYMWI